MENLRILIRLARPVFLLGAALVYALGVGIARYLGTTIDWNTYILGQAWVTLVQLSTHFLNEYYDAQADAENPNRTPFSGGSGMLGRGEGRLPRRTALLAGMTSLAFAASVTVVLIAEARLSPVAVLIMILTFLGAFFYSTPPISLESSGYGELTTSILVAFLVPAFGFVLQAGDLHRLVAMSTFSLVFLHLAMLISFELPDYGTDLKYDKRTLLVRMGWQNGMTLHNILIVVAFLLIALAASFGMPAFAALPALLPLPLGLLQIWQMRRIARGMRPNWTAVTLNGVALFASTAYLITFAFWTH